MHDYLKYAFTAFIFLLLIACAKRQRRYWREMHESKPTGSLRAGYKLAIFTLFTSLAVALYSNTVEGWELFMAILLMTAVFCVKITFSPAVVGVVLVICTYRMYVDDSFPLFEVWGGVLSVLAWRLPEEFRIVYTTLSFIWVMVIFLSGGNPASEPSSADDITDAAGLLNQ